MLLLPVKPIVASLVCKLYLIPADVGVCQFLTTEKYLSLRVFAILRAETSQYVTIQKLPVIAGVPVTVVKICCDCVNFVQLLWSNGSYMRVTHTFTLNSEMMSIVWCL